MQNRGDELNSIDAVFQAHSDQIELAQTGVTAAADDDVVVQRNAERGGGLNNVFGDHDIRSRGGRIA